MSKKDKKIHISVKFPCYSRKTVTICSKIARERNKIRMKKENKELAKQRRAEERRKRERNAKIKKVAIYGIPSLIVLILVIWVIFTMIQESKTDSSTTETEEAVESTEAVTDNVETDGNGLIIDESVAVEDGDTVNIDYVGSIDGVEFSGGNTQGAGADLTIGSGTYIDDFEEQLIGHYIGETVEVNVTFPENYGNEDLNGKDAVFEVTINGIYQE